MINIERDKYQGYKISYYDINNKYREKKVADMTLIPVKRIKNDGKLIKKVKDIYTKDDYYIKKVYNGKYRLTVPYMIHTNKEKIPYYDTPLGLKLLYFNDILKNNSNNLHFPKHMYYDIETTSLEPSEGIITSVVFIDENDKVKTFLNEGNEKEMLREIAYFLRKNNVMSLIGFNSKEFDDNYLAHRMRVNQIFFYNPINSCNIDIMKMCNKLFIRGSLASIAKQLGVIEKIELESNPIKLYYDGDYDTLIEYNIRDVEVTKAIAEEMNILPFCEALWKLSWCDFRHLNSNSRLNDCYFNKKLWEDDLIVTTADLDYRGAFGGGFNYIHI
ncbi:ribonuclease H-like domain-containing protein [bacterium]|nr:ribonuclease H-like domain-containing protein [bacterium]